METLRHVVVLVHIIGFALLLGGWAHQVFTGHKGVTKVMNLGLVIAAVSGLALAAPWGLAEGRELDYAKISVKLALLLVIGALMGISQAKAKKHDKVPSALFWGIGVVTVANAAVAVLWR